MSRRQYFYKFVDTYLYEGVPVEIYSEKREYIFQYFP